VYRYPLDAAVAIAVHEVVAAARVMPTLERVVFACFGADVLAAYDQALAALG
jgi:O-acetyl-ADP-ribose deacetylase (regulator of RNase III)